MKAMSCSGSVYDSIEPWKRIGDCVEVGTPATMYAVEEDPDGARVPMCASCARRVYAWSYGAAPGVHVPVFEAVFATFVELGEEPEPMVADFVTFADEIGSGCSDFQQQAFERARAEDAAHVVRMGVPYGSTVAYLEEMPAFDELPTWAVIDTARDWWEHDRIEWCAELSPVDGSMYLVLHDDDKKRGK